jgi:hypothetical protein
MKMQFTKTNDTTPRPASTLLVSWLLLCAAIALHVTDEATHNFLAVYNPTVLALRVYARWLPLPVFTFKLWITGLVIGIAFLLSLSPLFLLRVRWIRPIAFVIAIFMILNGLQHTVGTILGRTVASVHFPRPMPGFCSSPILIAACIYVLIQLRNRKQPYRQI